MGSDKPTMEIVIVRWMHGREERRERVLQQVHRRLQTAPYSWAGLEMLMFRFGCVCDFETLL